MSEKETVKIDVSWRGTIHICIMLLESGTDEGKKNARDELYRAADILDKLRFGAKVSLA